MRIPLLDLSRQHEPLRSRIDAAIAEVLDTNAFVGGEKVEAFERRMAKRLGVTHAIGVSSGTDALLMVMMALGIGPGDDVITTPFTFFATVECILRVGAKPVFIDIDPATFNIDADRLQDAVTPQTRAIIPVHLFGQSADMTTIGAIAEHHGLAVVEDAAQSLGAIHSGRPVGTLGEAGCFSFFPSKNLGALGDGGMIVTDDDALATALRRVRHHGAEPKYLHRRVGGNFRLDAIQAAVLDVKLDELDTWNESRRANAAFYDGAFHRVDGIVTPLEAESCAHVYNQYCVRVQRRDDVRAWLREKGVSTGVYYPRALHQQPVLSDRDYDDGDFPEAVRASEEVLALPVFPGMTEAESTYVADHIIEAVTP